MDTIAVTLTDEQYDFIALALNIAKRNEEANSRFHSAADLDDTFRNLHQQKIQNILGTHPTQVAVETAASEAADLQATVDHKLNKRVADARANQAYDDGFKAGVKYQQASVPTTRTSGDQ